ncbi:hypothetical protein JTB14_012382 [Gonioctena quinquepunctata]|nr:hypothetical protein JTB14_012382 [Gonioctena quinquepunctata]
MGLGCSFLSKPITEKLSNDESNDRLGYGASSMQGWRLTQEDDHNCLLDFDTNTSFFAVYDGHGGHEVAQYCSQNLPQYIKDTAAYKEGDIERALIEGFLGFDGTIATPEVVKILSKMAGDDSMNDDGSDEEENIDNLYEEATMPIDQVIEKYAIEKFANPSLKNLKKGEFPKSPYLKAKKDTVDDAACSTSSSSKEVENKDVKSEEPSGVSSSNSEASEAKASKEAEEDSKKSSESNGSVPQIQVSSPDSSDSKEAAAATVTPKNDEKSLQNGEISESQSKDDISSSTPQENGDVSAKGKGKAIAKSKTPPKTPVNDRPKRNASQLYKTLLNFVQETEDDETEDDEDQTFEGPNEESSEDDDEGVNIAIEDEGSEEEGESSTEVEDEEEDEEEEDEDDEEHVIGEELDKPGSISGCTAVVAVLKGNELYVANAGDSRCIVCRNGKAIEMSLDHKPEDDIERERIKKAGGRVNFEGRVNGGLNLSRAIGDHSYKQNKELSDKEQMITALPDIKTLTVNPSKDEFMVLACDGIWNFMSSQEVVDFVRPRIGTCEDKLSTVCEEMFDHCLAPNTLGDGTGCDNMTAIIIKFKSNILKRSASPRPADTESKKAKTEEQDNVESTV